MTAKKTPKTIFTCQSCGYQTPRWMGKCPECQQWDSMTEERRTGKQAITALTGSKVVAQPIPIDAVGLDAETRRLTGIAEFDRVLGGGLVAGSLVLIGGDPGIGKSTLMLQALYGLAVSGARVLYVSGEESVRQIRLRSQRLQTVAPDLLVVSEIDLDQIVQMVE
ncbi:MAG: ATPase domain-containing protein, partial [Desulfobacterales bacterium]